MHLPLVFLGDRVTLVYAVLSAVSMVYGEVAAGRGPPLDQTIREMHSPKQTYSTIPAVIGDGAGGSARDRRRASRSQ